MEIAWNNALVFAQGQRPRLEMVDDILFDKPVDLGSLLYFSSQVAYTEDNRMQVRVGAKAFDPQGETKETNVFHFTLIVDNPVRRVVPKTYQDSIIFLNARRHYQSFLELLS